MTLAFLFNIDEFINTINSKNIKWVLFVDELNISLLLIESNIIKIKKNVSEEKYKEFKINFARSIYYDIVVDYGINYFFILKKYGILNNVIENLRIDDDNYYYNKDISILITYCLKKDKTEILNYLLDNGFSKKELRYFLEKSRKNKKNHIRKIVQNDQIETFEFVVTKTDPSNKFIKHIIKSTGKFIKDYIKILFNNGKLDLDDLELLKKSIKNNLDKKLKKYVKKLILNEKIEIKII